MEHLAEPPGQLFALPLFPIVVIVVIAIIFIENQMPIRTQFGPDVVHQDQVRQASVPQLMVFGLMLR